MKRLVICAALVASACASPGVVVKDRIVEVKVPVAQPCVSGARPVPVQPLKQAFTDGAWSALDVRQKAAVVGKQGLAHKSYGEDLNASTAACP